MYGLLRRIQVRQVIPSAKISDFSDPLKVQCENDERKQREVRQTVDLGRVQVQHSLCLKEMR